MSNLQGVLTGATLEAVACAVICCDRKSYNLKNKGNNCQRLGSKKHSCVLHKLRKEDKSGKMTKESKFKQGTTEVQASPRYPAPPKKAKYIPDIKIGALAVDLKFPCKDPVKTGKGVINNSDMSRSGDSMLTDKEEGYLNIKDPKHGDVKDKQGYSPRDAKQDKSACDCTK